MSGRATPAEKTGAGNGCAPGSVSTAGAADGIEDDLLFALRVCGALSAESAAIVLGVPRPRLEEVLGDLRRAIFVTAVPGSARFGLSAEGRARADGIVKRESLAIGSQLEGLRPAFETQDRRVKRVVSAWQIRRVGNAEVVNDHGDAGYDAAVLGELEATFRDARRLLDALGALRPRYVVYRERLSVALDRSLGGGRAWVCGLDVDSFHTVWWQLHADIRAVLGSGVGEDA